VSHVHLTAEFVLFFTGAAHPGVAGEEKRIKDWHGDHEFTAGMYLASYTSSFPILNGHKKY
jgi:hypothetical protein